MKKTILTTSILLALGFSGASFALNDDSATATDGAAAVENSASANESAGAVAGPAAADDSTASISNGYNDLSDNDTADIDIDDSLKFTDSLNDRSDNDTVDADISDTLKDFLNDNSDNSAHASDSYNQDNDFTLNINAAVATSDLDATVTNVTTGAGGALLGLGAFTSENAISGSFSGASGITVVGQNNSVGSVVQQSVVVQSNLQF